MNQGKRFGYARVSLSSQKEDRQLDILKGHYGINEEDIFVDKMTGAHGSTKLREQFQRLQLVLRSGDTVYIESLSRLSRSLKELLELLEDWDKKGINLVSYKENIDLQSVTGRLVVHILAALAEFERENLRERVREGVASARARGRKCGRPRTDKRKLEKAVRLYAAKSHSVKEICELCGVSPSVLYRELKSRRARSELLTYEF